MANTKITTPDLIDLPAVNNFAGVVLPKGPTSGLEVHYLVVAGGGGSGSNSNSGGGGAGGYRTSYPSGTAIAPSLGSAISIIVGTGGASGNPYGTNGTDSTLDSITSSGGGYGGGISSNGGSGGSGGGPGFQASTPGTGNAGGFTPVEGFAGGPPLGSYQAGGGGGGASEIGKTNGRGGDGAISTIITTSIASTYSVGEVDGSDVYFAGGGGGGATSASLDGGKGGGANGGNAGGAGAVNAPANTGGGGGGGTYNNGGSAGGSGVIIIRVPTGITASFSSGVTANGSTGGTISPDTSTGDNIWVVTATTDTSQTVTFSGTVTGGRPSSAVDGEFRYNTDTKKVEYYDGSNWHQLSSSTVVPQSGTTGVCNYPTTASALFQLDTNTNDTCGSNNGTNNNVTFNTSIKKYGTASAEFNGTNADIDLPAGINGTTMSVSFWMYIDATVSSDQVVFELQGTGGGSAGQDGYGVFFTAGGGGKLYMQTLNSNSNHTRSNVAIPASQWLHIAAVWDAGSRTFYIDNVAQTTGGTQTTYLTMNANTIGSRGSGEFFDGYLDQVRFFNTALTATQVNALYTETAP